MAKYKLISLLTFLTINIWAQDSLYTKGAAIQHITTNSFVGNWGIMIRSIDVTVNNPSILHTIKASDFNLIGNAPCMLYEPSTGGPIRDYADDSITISYEGSILHIKARPFTNGKRNEKFQKVSWKMECKNPNLSFSMNDVDENTLEIIDNCIHGTYSFAGITREYMLYLPKDKNGNAMKNLPLFVWQIGGGEYNQDMLTAAIANRCLVSLPQHGYQCATLLFAIANPNYSYNAALHPEKLELIDRNNALQMAFIDELIANGTIDGNRLFCAGASSGGGCTMRFMMQFPNRFKAAIPCCAMDPIVPIHNVKETYDGQWLNDVTQKFQDKVYKWNGTQMELQPIDTEAFINLPMYFVHAEKDNTCKVASSKVYYAARKRLGAKNDKIKIFNDAEMLEYGFGGRMSHFSWCRLLDDYSKGTAMDWLVQQF